MLRFLGARVGEPGRVRMVPTRANGQRAVGAYERGADGVHRAHSLQVLHVRLLHAPGALDVHAPRAHLVHAPSALGVRGVHSSRAPGVHEVRIARITAFLDPELFGRFGLPQVLS